MKQALLIANPGSGAGGSGVATIESVFRAGGVALDVHRSESAEDARARIRGAGDAIDALLILGGDGTLHHALPAVLERGLPLGVLPGGTANDFARGLGIPMDLEAACRALLHGREQRVDVAFAGDVPFVNAVHMGLVAKAASSASADAKRHLGALAYLGSLLGRLRSDPGFKVDVECDGRRRKLRSIQVTAGNAPYFGGGNLVHADAALDDGLLYAYSVRPSSVLRLLFLGVLLRRGRGDENDGVDRLVGRRMVIRPRRRMEFTADGEPVGTTPVELRLRHGALTVIVPGEPVSAAAGAEPRLVEGGQ